MQYKVDNYLPDIKQFEAMQVLKHMHKSCTNYRLHEYSQGHQF
jgi:hypothetical protein